MVIPGLLVCRAEVWKNLMFRWRDQQGRDGSLRGNSARRVLESLPCNPPLLSPRLFQGIDTINIPGNVKKLLSSPDCVFHPIFIVDKWVNSLFLEPVTSWFIHKIEIRTRLQDFSFIQKFWSIIPQWPQWYKLNINYKHISTLIDTKREISSVD